jgi:hypothetical protein
MHHPRGLFVLAAWSTILAMTGSPASLAATRYFAHEIHADDNGVIAPWYTGLNGQCDLRVRIAAETLKRYPWTTGKDGKPLPDYIYSGRWSIADDGTITPGPLKPWGNGDLVQRGTYAIFGWVKYYAYSGDPAAIAHISMIADALLDRCQTGPDHPWPNFIISVPNAGEPYGPCNDRGMIQLDLAAMAGVALVQAYEMTGNERWLDAAKHWADVLAAKRNRTPGEPPWNRYANPEVVYWNDRQTGGVVLLLRLFDDLIRIGYTGENNELIAARDAGRAYLRDTLLPAWYINDTFGRDYWDWEHPVQSETLSEMVPRYLMHNPDVFVNHTGETPVPQFMTDARNIMSLYLTRACVSPLSNGDVYHGAWSYPEGSQCCERSLSYAPMQVGAAFAEYAARTGSEWAREMARRQFILATYDARETGVVEDNMDGGQAVAGGWLQIAHPLPLYYVLEGMGWLPDLLGANRENHIMRTSSTVCCATYQPGEVRYSTFDTPTNNIDVLRLSFLPTRIYADEQELVPGNGLDDNTYRVQKLPNDDCIVTLRHDQGATVAVSGKDPARRIQRKDIRFEGEWGRFEVSEPDTYQVFTWSSSRAGNSAAVKFEGNQVRVESYVGPWGGKADVYIDGLKQLCGIDYWHPSRASGTVYSQSGLANGQHEIKIVATGTKNPFAHDTRIAIENVDASAATGDAGFGASGGPTDAQRWIFGYTGRQDHVDAQGNTWRPATECVIRLGHVADAVTAWYVEPRRQHVAGTDDPVLYRHGMHGKDFTAYATVGPGEYHVRLKFMESRTDDPTKRAMDILINGKPVVSDLDIAATAMGRPATVAMIGPSQLKVYEGLNRAVDLVFNDIQPEHGMIAVRFVGKNGGEAIVSALEVGPGKGGDGATPIQAAMPTTLPAPTPP